MSELLPCPFCGAANVVCTDQGDDDYAVTCLGCGSQSPFNDDKARVITTWNTRSGVAPSRNGCGILADWLEAKPKRHDQNGDRYLDPVQMSSEDQDLIVGALRYLASQTVLSDIHAERVRQIAKGYDANHDDEHGDGEIGIAAAAYITGDVSLYPWGAMPIGNRRGMLVSAAAMLIAEIERPDRATPSNANELFDIEPGFDAGEWTDGTQPSGPQESMA